MPIVLYETAGGLQAESAEMLDDALDFEFCRRENLDGRAHIFPRSMPRIRRRPWQGHRCAAVRPGLCVPSGERGQARFPDGRSPRSALRRTCCIRSLRLLPDRWKTPPVRRSERCRAYRSRERKRAGQPSIIPYSNPGYRRCCVSQFTTLRRLSGVCRVRQIAKELGVSESEVSRLFCNIIRDRRILSSKIRKTNGREGYERICEHNGGRILFTGIGPNGYIVSAYPHRFRKEK